MRIRLYWQNNKFYSARYHSSLQKYMFDFMTMLQTEYEADETMTDFLIEEIEDE